MHLKALFCPFRFKRGDLTKTLLVMRLTSILLLATCLHLSAKTGAQRITLSEQHSSLKKVFKEITGQTGYLFVYRDEWLRQAQRVDIAVKDASLQDVLSLCFNDQPFTYVIIDKMVVLKEKPVETPPPSAPVILYFEQSALIDVHGKVTDVNGNPLAGATVMVGMSNKETAESYAKWRTQSINKVANAGTPSAVASPATGNSTEPATATATPVPFPYGSQPVTMSAVVPAGATPSVTVAGSTVAGVANAGGNASGTSPHIFSLYVTDASGEFLLKGVPENATVFISNIGYETQEIKLNKRKELTIRMAIKANELKDLTVTFNSGYQILSKDRATGSFGKPDMQVYKERTGTMDVIGRLDGLVPGLTVNPTVYNANSNGNGVTTQSALIRGKTTVQLGTEPLYVVNGVPTADFSSVNPDDIADVTVLKDAAAAAIWGARAANGVIVLTTKEGIKNQRLAVSYSGFINFQGKPDFGYTHYLNSPQFIQAAKETFDPTDFPWSTLYSSPLAPHDVILYNQYRGLISTDQANKSLDSLASINNLQQIKDIFYRNAVTTNHTISASGGNNIYSFYASLGYTDVISNTPGQKNNTYRVNVTQNVNPSRNIKISLNTEMSDNVTSSKNYPSVPNTFLPYQLFKDASGKSISMPFILGWSDSLRQDYQARSGVNLDYNPIDEINYAHNSSNNLSFNVTANVGIHLWKGLGFQGTYGYLKAPGSSIYYEDSKSKDLREQLLSLTVAPTIGSTPIYYYPTTGGQYTTNNSDQRNWTVRNQLVYAATPRGGKDVLNLQVGQDAQENQNILSTTTVLGYDEQLNTYPVLDYATLRNGIFGTILGYGGLYSQPYQYSMSLTRFTSYFALGSYTLNHKYSLDLSWRQDHSNLFGHDQSTQNKPIWSLGGKWQIGREHFMEKTNRWMDNFALRATYGITGNSPYVGAASLYDILGAISSSNYQGAVAGNALSVNQPANNTLSWEITHTTNLGLDFTLMHNRISGNLDVYNKNTTDLIGNTPLNPFSGFSGTTGNVGRLRNQGIELALRTMNIQRRDFTWTTNFVFSYNKNKLLSYVAPNPQYFNASSKLYSFYLAGYAMSPLFAYRFAGLDNMGDPQIYLTDHSVSKDPNAAQVDDVKYMGTLQPVINGGFSNTFTYKGLSLAVNMVYNMGNVMRNDMNQYYTGRMWNTTSFNSTTITTDFLKRWKQPGDEKITNIPSYVGGYQSYSRRNTDYYTHGDLNVESASYAKIRDITLAYNLSSSLLQLVKVQTIRVYAQATNFMVWKANHDGIDPEYENASYGGRSIPPFKHSYSLGANITF